MKIKLNESYAIVNYYDNDGVEQEQIINGSEKAIENKLKKLDEKYEIKEIHQASADLKDNKCIDNLGIDIARLDYNNSSFKEADVNNGKIYVDKIIEKLNIIKDMIQHDYSKTGTREKVLAYIFQIENSLTKSKKLMDESEDNTNLPDEIVKYVYNNYPEASYTGDGKLGDRLVLYFDNFPQEAIDKLFKEFGNKITVRETYSEYAPELKHTIVIINNKINESDEYEEIASKSIPDSDGFTTDYTLYKNKDTGKYVCVFGDKDIYKPEDEDFDFETDYEDEAKEWFDGYNGFEEGEGTQVDDIAKKEDYPQFKVGKKISNLVEDEVIDNLEPEEKQKLAEIYNDKIIKGYKCTGCNKIIPSITDFNKRRTKSSGLHYYFCPFCNENYDFDQLKDIELQESYNYIGTDVDEEPRDNKSHKEKVFTVYDQYGEIGEYHTREEAQKVIDEWYCDPELYGEEGPQLRIEEDIIDVLNNKIVVPDDLAN